MSLKKLIVILLAFCLCGCAASPPDTPDENAPTEAADTAVVSFYEADSAVEKATKGAVRVYALDESYTALMPVGNMLMLVSGDGTITLLKGEQGQVTATAETDLSAAWGMTDLYIGKQTVGYYAADTQEVVILDHNLQQIFKVPLPDEMQGKPLVQLDKGVVLYCTTGQIRAMDVQSGISRMIRSHACMGQELLGSYFNDTVVCCLVVDAQGNESILYLDAETGQELYEDTASKDLQTYGDRYYAVLSQTEEHRIRFGNRNDLKMYLDLPVETVVPALVSDGVVAHEATEEGLQLTFYNLSTGLKTAQIEIPELETGKITATEDGCVWMLDGQTLYRWDTSKSGVKDETLYTGRIFTWDDPDLDGLAACAEKAGQLAEKYGLTLRVWEEAAAAGTEYQAVAEYRVPETQQMLDQLEQILTQLPKDFMTITGNVHVNLVQSLGSSAQRELHWEDGVCHVFLTAANTGEDFLWALGNAVDTHVLGNSFDYDKWEDLNPWRFEYTYDYEENLERDNPEEFLEGSDRAFTDLEAMSFPTEDRSRLFANALLEDNQEMFVSSTMQKKLRGICVAIREAYGWEDSTDVFAWEQYLDKSIAAKS